MLQKTHKIILSLGSNDDAEQHLADAREQLNLLLSDVHFTTAIWTDEILSENNSKTENKHIYLNQLCSATTNFGINLLEEVLKELEKRLGRTHNEDGIVAIDIDLLQYDDTRYHLRDWSRPYVSNLIGEILTDHN